MSKPQLQELFFQIFPSALPPEEIRNLHDNTYRLWVDVWQETLAKLKLKADDLPAEFNRQDYIGCISHRSNPVAVHLYSFYDISSKAARDHHYLKGNYPEEFFQRLQNWNIKTVMSMEYMTVHPEWRKSAGSFHIGVVLVGLTLRAMQNFGIDAAIAPCRKDHKVQLLAYAYGGEPVLEDVQNHNVTCDLAVVRNEKVKAHENEEIQALLDHYWSRMKFHPSPQVGSATSANVIPFNRNKKAA